MARKPQIILSSLDVDRIEALLAAIPSVVYGAWGAAFLAKEISPAYNWLAANAGSSRRGRDEPPQDRITQSAWFLRKHDEVPARTWKLPAVKSPSNCVACHARAEQGDFNEHNVRLPR